MNFPSSLIITLDETAQTYKEIFGSLDWPLSYVYLLCIYNCGNQIYYNDSQYETIFEHLMTDGAAAIASKNGAMETRSY